MKIVRRWLADDPTEYGFATELWTAPRLAQLIEQEWSIHFHPDYLGTWRRPRGYTPQTSLSDLYATAESVRSSISTHSGEGTSVPAAP
jgi:transposase